MKIDIKNVFFEKVATNKNEYPKLDLPEICICGRSNVGKSSLINSLFNKELAKVGSTPGKTRFIIFFNVDNKFRMVDLPGYGYAKVSKDEKLRWKNMMEEYLNLNKNLKLCIILLDIRILPTDDDKLMIEFFSKRNLPIMIVLTKSDKLSNNQIVKQINLIAKELNISNEMMFVVSSKSGSGIKTIRSTIVDFIEELYEEGKKE